MPHTRLSLRQRIKITAPNLSLNTPAKADAIFESRIVGDTSPQARTEVSQRTGVPEEKLKYGPVGAGAYVLPAAVVGGTAALAANPVTGPVVGKLALAGLTTAFLKESADHIFGEENVDEFIYNYVEPVAPYLAMNPQLVSAAAQSVRNPLGHYGANAIPRVQAFNRKAFPNAYQRYLARHGYTPYEPITTPTPTPPTPPTPPALLPPPVSPQMYNLPANATVPMLATRLKPTIHKVFSGNHGFGLFKDMPNAVATKSDWAVRMTDMKELDDMLNTGVVQANPNSTRYVKNGVGTKYWSTGGDDLFIPPNRVGIVAGKNVVYDGLQGQVPLNNLKHVFVNGEDILPSILNGQYKTPTFYRHATGKPFNNQ